MDYAGGYPSTVIGVIMLFFGRKLFWLYVGCLGFVVGFEYAPYIWQIQSNLSMVISAIITGIIGAVLALFFQKIAIGFAGFVAGGYIALNLITLLGPGLEQAVWLPYVIGGIIGALLLFFIFDWALIFVSSLTGAMLIVQAAKLSPGMGTLVYFALVIAGVALQTLMYRRTAPSQKKMKPLFHKFSLQMVAVAERAKIT